MSNKFDKYGRRLNPNFEQTPLSTFRPSSNYTTYRSANWWEQFNEFISDIGEWLEDNAGAITGNLAMLYFVLCWIAYAIGIIVTWVNEGFWSALFTGLIGGVITYYGSMIITGILIYVLQIPVWILRGILYNAYTLIVVILIIVGVLFYNNSNVGERVMSYDKVQTEIAAPQTSKYYCTANSALNVRYSPSSSSRVIGSLRKGQFVDAYEITNNGFAKIKYGNGVGYASVKYLRKYQP